MYNYVTNINVTITISCGNSPLVEIIIISLVTRTMFTQLLQRLHVHCTETNDNN